MESAGEATDQDIKVPKQAYKKLKGLRCKIYVTPGTRVLHYCTEAKAFVCLDRVLCHGADPNDALI